MLGRVSLSLHMVTIPDWSGIIEVGQEFAEDIAALLKNHQSKLLKFVSVPPVNLTVRFVQNVTEEILLLVSVWFKR